MDGLALDAINILRYLLPGFLTAWIFYGFTSYPRPSQFERVIQALIFTLLIQLTVSFISIFSLKLGQYFSVGIWSSEAELTISILVASILGFIFAFFANNDKFHSLIRYFRVTKETSYHSEWYGIFSRNITWVVLHLSDGRRIYGWPLEWPSVYGKGHFCITHASWLDCEEEKPITGVESVLIRCEDVILVEFMEKMEISDE